MRTSALAAAGAAGAVALHALPGLSNVDVLRRHTLPRLSGVGFADHLALTFDDGPQADSTPAFLEALDRLGWKATFFMLGSRSTRTRDLPPRWPPPDTR